MMHVLKYQFTLSLNEFWLPADAAILHVGEQNGQVMLWALVDSKAKNVSRKFAIVPTGREFDNTGMTFIGTSQGESGEVWHIFELMKSTVSTSCGGCDDN